VQRPQPLHLRRIMKDDTNRVAAPGAETAYAVAQVHSIGSSGPLNRPMMNGKGNGIALRQRHNLGARLHPRPLFGQNKLAASKVFAGLGE
jgi:hypothetical protein